MTPPCYTFSAAELQERVQLDVHGRQRKMLTGSPVPMAVIGKQSVNGTTEKTERPRYNGIDLARDCTLLSSMVQYSCSVVHPEMRDSPVRCWPVQRMFRRCQDRLGSFMVETTAWEGTRSPDSSPFDSEESSNGSSGIAKEPALENGESASFSLPSATASTATIPCPQLEKTPGA